MSGDFEYQAAMTLLGGAKQLLKSYSAAQKRVAFVATSYDTAFESVSDQVDARINELIDTFGVDGPIKWSFWIVDDLPVSETFTESILNGFDRHPDVRDQGRLHCLRLTSARRTIEGLKGRALLDGMSAALASESDLQAVVYVNLNLKVHVAYAAFGLVPVLDNRCDVAVGSRWSGDGGMALGGGSLGHIKSRVYSRIARTALPPLMGYVDTNAPMKIFSKKAAKVLIARARIDHVTFDCEWLMIAQSAGLRLFRFPLAWIQRPGSSPPWHYIPRALYDVWRIRRRWRSGTLTSTKDLS